MNKIVEWILPIKIYNEANSSIHWSKKSKRHRMQKRWIKAAFLQDRPQITTPCAVVVTRISPRQLDSHDNLIISLKWVVDAIAENITGDLVPGRADGNKNITWKYAQEKGEARQYALKIEIFYDS